MPKKLKRDNDEILDIVNEYDQVIGFDTRGNIYEAGLPNFRVINIFLIDSHGRLLITRRSTYKAYLPLHLDASAGGHVLKGEYYIDAFKREALQELGLSIQHFRYQCIGYFSPHTTSLSAFMMVFAIYTNETPVFNRDEICEAIWLTPTEALAMLEEGEQSKSDLPILINFLFNNSIYPYDASTDWNLIDLSKINLPRNEIEPWIEPYIKHWQKIKDIDNRDQLDFSSPISWADYYLKKAEIAYRGYRNYHTRRIIENYPFYNFVLEKAADGPTLELGIGAGTGVLEMMKRRRIIFGVDNEKEIIDLVRSNAAKLGEKKKVNIILANIANLPFKSRTFRLSYCHGSFEHYSEDAATSLIREALRVSENLIFAVPIVLANDLENRKALKLTLNEDKPNSSQGGNFGDERLLTTSSWEYYIGQAGGMIIGSYGYWLPLHRSKTIHPREPQRFYGQGIYAYYHVVTCS